uniref:alanine transaminase n=1 Tax=Amphiprion ocellaris TaxID=80972 RepID=A0A3Q1B907_AMPOC
SRQFSSQGVNKPFKRVTDVSSGDPHRAGMRPISFVRQVLAVCLYPELLKEESLHLDVRQRAQRLLDTCNGGSVGSYSVAACGIPQVLKAVAEFITRRDGGFLLHPNFLVTCNNVFILSLFISLVPYRLVEERGWAVDLDELHRAVTTARGRCQPRAIYISNPGNPTGHVQDRETIEKVIRFAATEHLILLVEEVYQDSVYGQDKEFMSYKKVLFEMGKRYSETVELVSFHSILTACLGECGLRGGYMEVVNMDPAVKKYLSNMHGFSSPPVLPQVFSSHAFINIRLLLLKKILHIKDTLSQNAQQACEFLNGLPGMSCQPAMGGVFLYPRLHLTPPVIKEAKMLGVEADVLYCQKLLEEEGVCLGAGCENRQEDTNFHIRLCVLAAPVTLEEVLARLRSFHLRLLDTFPL